MKLNLCSSLFPVSADSQELTELLGERSLFRRISWNTGRHPLAPVWHGPGCSEGLVTRGSSECAPRGGLGRGAGTAVVSALRSD